MMLRIQRERQGRNFFPSLDEYSRYFCLTRAALARGQAGRRRPAPGPINRGVEIASDVADGAASVIMDQVTNGVAVRMAVLFLLANRVRQAGRRARRRSPSQSRSPSGCAGGPG